MLILTRKNGQSLSIGKDIVVTITRIAGNTVRVGIEAPNDVKVLRSELEVYDHDIPVPKLEPVT